MTDGQTTSIAITIIAALVVLMIVFWATEFKPMLAVIAVSPILLVLLWVLGTMTLLGIPYNVVTAHITALSIPSALTTALAFVVLLFSPLIPFQQFGLVTGITILFALIAAIVIVPPMLIVWAAYHQWRAGIDH